MAVSVNVLKKSGVPMVVDCYLDTDSWLVDSEQIIWIIVSKGNRVQIRYYYFNDLQRRLMDCINSKETDNNNSNYNLTSILEKKQYFVLKPILSSDFLPEGIPRLEEASEITQFIYVELLVGSNNAYYVDESDYETFASRFCLTWKQVEECLKRDIECFDLQDVLGLHKYDAAVYAFSGILTRFSTDDLV